MSGAEPLSVQDFVVELDYGQFSLDTMDSDPDLGVEVLEEALAGDGIAQRNGLLIVTSPHQNNFEMPLRVEVWSAAPPDDLADWEEAFETALTVGDDGITYNSPTGDFTNIEVPPGTYRTLITGTGFVAHGWPGSTEPGDRWRIRLWPDPAPVPARRLKAWVDESLPARDSAEARSAEANRELAQQAGDRICTDLDRDPGARPLSGKLGAATVEAVLDREIDAVWSLIENLDITLMGGGASIAPSVVGGTFTLDTYDPEEDGFLGTDGWIECQWAELTPPTRAAMTWRWMHGRTMTSEPRPWLDQQATFTVTLTDLTLDPDTPRVRIQLRHEDIPVEWVDMAIVWRSKIDQWDYQSRPKRRGR